MFFMGHGTRMYEAEIFLRASDLSFSIFFKRLVCLTISSGDHFERMNS